MSEKCVQGTNDSSIVSKASAAERGYFQDTFLAHMISKRVRRAPLINRGYYIRMKAVDQALRHFIQITSDEKCTRYIVSLGAGFDTAYFRLKTSGLLRGVLFIEIDFYDVALNKAKLIQQSEALSSVIGPFEIKLDSNILLRSPDYCLLASDLTHEAVLDACFRELIPDWEAPIFFLSECVLTYVTPKKCQHFKSLGSPLKCIETYSQLSDQKKRFSIGWYLVEAQDMNQFFYQSLESEERNRIERLEVFDEYEEWSAKCEHYFVLAAQSASFYHRHRRERFFPADADAAAAAETESAIGSWRLDYGLGQRALGRLNRVRARQLPSGCEYPFRLHWAALATVELQGPQQQRQLQLVRIGGYGRDPLSAPGHRRLTCLTLVDPYRSVQPCHLVPDCPEGAAEWLEHGLGALVCRCDLAELLVFGGKASPLRATNKLLRVRLQMAACASASGGVSAAVSEVAQRGSPAAPCARWRHAGCLVNLHQHQQLLVVYGGRTPDCLCLDDAYVCALPPSQAPANSSAAAVVWESLPATPGPRCSAAMCAHPGRPLCYLSGGFTANIQCQGHPRPVWDLWQLDMVARQWTQISLRSPLPGEPGLPVPRFGHSLHCLTAAGTREAPADGSDGVWFVCFGGVAISAAAAESPILSVLRVSDSGGGADFINMGVEFSADSVASGNFLAFNAATAVVSAPASTDDDDRQPLLVAIGGGGSCFSFGTHLNAAAVCVPLADILLPVASLF